MMKKLLITIVIILLLLSGLGLYSALKYRQSVRQQRATAKAPQTSITLLEGWSNKQIADYLTGQHIIAEPVDFLSAVKNFDTTAYNSLLSKNAQGNLQGFLFPDTYFIPTQPASGQNISQIIIKKALDNFAQKVTEQMRQQAKAQGLSLYQIVTLASVIEKEAGQTGDKPAIAGIFYNRMKIGMPLESDATISYVTGSATISADDKKIASPYNTYLNKGLPQGPICNPSLSSIEAALYPAASDYIYFLTDPKTGKAIFAKTYEEHLKNKQKYLQ